MKMNDKFERAGKGFSLCYFGAVFSILALALGVAGATVFVAAFQERAALVSMVVLLAATVAADGILLAGLAVCLPAHEAFRPALALTAAELVLGVAAALLPEGLAVLSAVLSVARGLLSLFAARCVFRAGGELLQEMGKVNGVQFASRLCRTYTICAAIGLLSDPLELVLNMPQFDQLDFLLTYVADFGLAIVSLVALATYLEFLNRARKNLLRRTGK